MKIQRFNHVEVHQEAPGVAMRTVIGAQDGAPRFAMRVFEVQPGASTPYHTHDWEHEVFVITGEGLVRTVDGNHTIGTGVVVYVAPGEQHCFANTGQDILRFVCCIPANPD